MAQYTRYEKLQKYYKDGIAVEPAEYKKGKNLGVAEYSSIEECQNSSTPLTNCIGWKSTDNTLSYSINDTLYSTSNSPLCIDDTVTKLQLGTVNPNITELDLSSFDSSSLTSMMSMFEGNTNLVNLDVSRFNTENCKNFSSMFSNCEKLTSINVSNFNFNNCETLRYMFSF